MRYAILTCKSSQTLAITEDLLDHGLESWAPRWATYRRLPRSRSRTLVVRPLLPGFIFVEVSDLPFVKKLVATREVHACTEFVVNGAGARVDDADLQWLRTLDGTTFKPPKRATGADQWRPTVGAEVAIMAGPATGQTGIVEAYHAPYFTVALKNSTLALNVLPFLLRPLGV